MAGNYNAKLREKWIEPNRINAQSSQSSTKLEVNFGGSPKTTNTNNPAARETAQSTHLAYTYVSLVISAI
jgi:hypothetical protein